jgi:hypothetical protein
VVVGAHIGAPKTGSINPQSAKRDRQTRLIKFTFRGAKEIKKPENFIKRFQSGNGSKPVSPENIRFALAIVQALWNIGVPVSTAI